MRSSAEENALDYHADGSPRLRCCTSCGTKPLSEFARRGPGGRYVIATCRSCEVKRVAAWTKLNPEKRNARVRRHYALYPERKRRIQAMRRAAERGLTQDEKRDVEAIYAEARRLTVATNVPHEVAHWPKSVDAGGLTHPSNLSITDRSTNRSASTKKPRELPASVRAKFEQGAALVRAVLTTRGPRP